MGITRCPFPDKEKLTKREAILRAAALNRRPGARHLTYYACPGGGHHHVGHKYTPKRKRY